MGKAVLITGATSGIGKGLAYEFAKRGYSLGLAARRLEELEKIREDLASKYPSVKVDIRKLDVTDYESVPGTIKEMARALGNLDIVVANAGIGLAGKIGVGNFAAHKKTVETNLLGAMATVDAATEYFLEQGWGHVVGISSVAAHRGFRRFSAYGASKVGLALYLEALRLEVLHKKIHVTVLYPGYIDTPLNNMMKNRPFVIPVEAGARKIVRLVEKKVKSKNVPAFPWCFLARILPWLPDSIAAKM